MNGWLQFLPSPLSQGPLSAHSRSSKEGDGLCLEASCPDYFPWEGGTPSLGLASKTAQLCSAGEGGWAALQSWVGTRDAGQ